ncbi:D-inositol-3-phosphate glycosyltransferase [Aeromonas dhakensis]|uniref:glycosyltransferase n=1 Tax=Aeromonas dhakensis TaxID=196024 RepID=UPI000E3EAA05|nr:glycosyltransferase [Aeromonas dhakensis]RFS23126.1 glycosyltransferase [Aeromonas dhakensis]HDX8374891.1 glycosyltransferase [Aeromonas dhakensis]HDX8434699.1 glycosyltransferase [Aeromonas dhakensis]
MSGNQMVPFVASTPILTDTRVSFVPEWHQQLLSGQRKAIGWGISGDIHYCLLQAPYPLAGLIDGMRGPLVGKEFSGLPVFAPEVLDEYESDEIVIIIFSDYRMFGAEICAQIATFGEFCVQTPYVAARDDQLSQPNSVWPQQLANLMRQLRSQSLIHQPQQRISLWIHALVKGGAERQMVLLALGLTQLGWQVQLICSNTTNSENNIWVAQLQQAGVELVFLPPQRDIWPQLTQSGELRELAIMLAPYFESGLLHNIITSYTVLKAFRPKILACYLDDGNVCASMAALLYGIEHILVAGRNVAPSLIPPGITGYDINRLAEYYHQFMALPGCVLFNNSGAGAESYAQWLGVAPDTIPVVRNAVMPPMQQEPVTNIRERLGLPSSARVLLGAMRFSPEKTPEAFVHVVSEVIRQCPDVYAVLLGKGPLELALGEQVTELGMADRILLPGVQDDIFNWLQQSDLLLSTSSFEGMSNIILEAQSVGCLVVATDIPGNRETLLPILVEEGCLIPHGQWRQMSERILALLQQPPVGLSLRLQEEMQRHYSPQRLAEQTLALRSI